MEQNQNICEVREGFKVRYDTKETVKTSGTQLNFYGDEKKVGFWTSFAPISP